MSVRLEPGREVDVRLPGRKTYVRATVRRITETTVDVIDPRNGGVRTVTHDAIRTVHRKEKLR